MLEQEMASVWRTASFWSLEAWQHHLLHAWLFSSCLKSERGVEVCSEGSVPEAERYINQRSINLL